jgi:hypothetical protein
MKKYFLLLAFLLTVIVSNAQNFNWTRHYPTDSTKINGLFNGKMWYCSVHNRFEAYENGAIVTLSGGSGWLLTGTTTLTGDVTIDGSTRVVVIGDLTNEYLSIDNDAHTATLEGTTATLSGTTSALVTGQDAATIEATTHNTSIVVDDGIAIDAGLGGLTIANLVTATHANSLYYNTATGEITYDAAPSGGSGGAMLQTKTVSATTYTALATDTLYIVHFSNASGCTVTLPNTLPQDWTVNFIRNEGAGDVTFDDDGTSVLKASTAVFTLNAENTVAMWRKYDATVFYGAGELNVQDWQAIIDAKVADAINNGTTTIAPSQNAVFDALALKADLAGPTFTGTVVLPSTTSIGTVTNTELSYVDGVTSAIQTQLDTKESLTSASTSTAGGTVTLDMNSLRQKMFVGSASFATSRTMAFSNTTNALVFNFHFEITAVAATLVFPSDVVMSDPAWDTATQTWTPVATGQYLMSGTYDGTNWKVIISNPFN